MGNAAEVKKPGWLVPIVTALTVAAVSFGSFAVLGTFSATLLDGHQKGVWLPIFQQRFLAVVGIPTCVFTSIGVVEFFKGFHGPVKFRVSGGIEFDGATGPVILWIFCFIATASMMKVLW